MKNLIKVKLLFNGTFEIENIQVISNTKNGDVIGYEEKIIDDTIKNVKVKQPIYEQIEAKVWKTSIGNFNIETQLNKIKHFDLGYYIISNNENLIEIKKQLLEYAINIQQVEINKCEDKLIKLKENIEETTNKEKSLFILKCIFEEVKL